MAAKSGGILLSFNRDLIQVNHLSEILGMSMPFFGLIFLGYFSAKLSDLPASGLAWMNFFIIYVALPALLFNLVSRTPVEQFSNWSFVLPALLATFCAFVLAFSVGAFSSKGNIPESTIQGLAGAYGNIGYMGPGLAIVALGPEAGVPVALIFCFDNTLHFVMAPLLMTIGGQGDEKKRLRMIGAILYRIFTHPFILATIAGVIAASLNFRPPGPVQTLLDYLMNAAAPCALFAMGVTVALAPQGRMPRDISFLVPIKLIIHPVLVYLFLSAFGNFDKTWVFAAVLLASLPTATNVYVIAQQYDVWVARASSMVLISTVFSVVTVTGLLYLMTTGVLPADLFP